MAETIKFYSVNDDYGEFSNFAQYPIRVRGKVWPTSEHFFQAMKFESKQDQEEIRKTKSPMQAALKGRDRKKKLRRNWESMKVGVMKEALLAKFQQHEELRKVLLQTNNSKLIEHTENDSYWGDGGDGKGKNMLGVLLMQVRSELNA